MRRVQLSEPDGPETSIPWARCHSSPLGTDLIGHDDEATGDGSHRSDLGAMLYADAVATKLFEILSPDAEEPPHTEPDDTPCRSLRPQPERGLDAPRQGEAVTE